MAGDRKILIGDVEITVPFEGTYEHEDSFFNHAEGYGEPGYTDVDVATTLGPEDAAELVRKELEDLGDLMGAITIDGDVLIDMINERLGEDEWLDAEDFLFDDR
jgi:hypothetical protein